MRQNFSNSKRTVTICVGFTLTLIAVSWYHAWLSSSPTSNSSWWFQSSSSSPPLASSEDLDEENDEGTITYAVVPNSNDALLLEEESDSSSSSSSSSSAPPERKNTLESKIKKKKLQLCYFMPAFNKKELWEEKFVGYELFDGLQDVAVKYVFTKFLSSREDAPGERKPLSPSQLASFHARNVTLMQYYPMIDAMNGSLLPPPQIYDANMKDYVNRVNARRPFDCSKCDYAVRLFAYFSSLAKDALNQLKTVCPNAKRYGLIQTSDEHALDEGPSHEQMNDPRFVMYLKQYYNEDR